LSLRLPSGQARLILALALALSATPAFGQAEADWTVQERREAARERRQERREEQRDARRERWEQWRRDGREGLHFRMMRDYYLAADAIAHEPIVVFGGNATIDGRTEDDVVVIGGRLRLGPKAVVGGDVTTVGGDAIIDPGATVRGRIDRTVVDVPNVDWGLNWPVWRWRGWWPLAALSATVLRLSLVLLISLLITIVAPNWVRSMGVHASSVVSSGLVGAVTEVLLVPVVIVVVLGLAISIIGIPLLGAIPFALALGALAWTGGFAAVAACLGARLRGTSIERTSSLVTDLLVGFAAISALSLIAHVVSVGPSGLTRLGWIAGAVGMAVEYVAWTIGLGAVIYGRFVRSSAVPPPMPAPSASF
jgi:hypothetical protein